MNYIIKFRGKRKDNGGWVYGFYYEKPQPLQCIKSDDDKPEEEVCYILFPGFADWGMPRPMYQAEVVPETVGQYVGLRDDKGEGKEMYNGDIFKDWEGKLSIIRWVDYQWKFEAIGECFRYRENFHNVGKVIGNIFDNPELLKK